MGSCGCLNDKTCETCRYSERDWDGVPFCANLDSERFGGMCIFNAGCGVWEGKANDAGGIPERRRD